MNLLVRFSLNEPNNDLFINLHNLHCKAIPFTEEHLYIVLEYLLLSILLVIFFSLIERKWRDKK